MAEHCPTVTIIYRDPDHPEWGFEITSDSPEVCIEAINAAFDCGSVSYPTLLLMEPAS